MLDVGDWAEIRRLHNAEKLGIKTIARRLGVARNTVRAALRSDATPRYERRSQSSIVDAVESEIRELLGEFPEMPAAVIAERIGWTRGMTVLRDRIMQARRRTDITLNTCQGTVLDSVRKPHGLVHVASATRYFSYPCNLSVSHPVMLMTKAREQA